MKMLLRFLLGCRRRRHHVVANTTDGLWCALGVAAGGNVVGRNQPRAACGGTAGVRAALQVAGVPT